MDEPSFRPEAFQAVSVLKAPVSPSLQAYHGPKTLFVVGLFPTIQLDRHDMEP